MPARVWTALAGLIVLLLVAVIGLDQRQARRGEPSLFALGWAPSLPGARAPASPPRVAAPAPAPSAPGGGPRVAVIVADLGSRRDVFDLLLDLRRAVTVAVLPGLPLSAALAREARQAGMEVLVALPMEPYRYPEVDPGPGALLMAMGPAEIQRRVSAHLEAVPAAAGAATYLGSRLTEDRTRMRAVLEVLRARGRYLVDAYASSLSVASDEARTLGVRVARRQVLIDPGLGEAGQRAGWEAAASRAERRGEAVVLAHAHPLVARLLREYLPRWEARGIRLVPASTLAR